MPLAGALTLDDDASAAQDQRAWEEAGQAALGAPLWDLVQNKKPKAQGAQRPASPRKVAVPRSFTALRESNADSRRTYAAQASRW